MTIGPHAHEDGTAEGLSQSDRISGSPGAIPSICYSDGLATISNGESLEVLATLDEESVDAFVTDPPYIIGAVSAGNIAAKGGGWADMMNSALWFATWYRLAARALKPTGSLWTCCNWRSLPVVMRAALDAGLPVTSLVVWDKEWIGPGGVKGLRPSYELVALIARPEFAVPNRSERDVWRIKTGGHKPHGHPAEKPVALMEKIISVAALQPGAFVVDPFMGSGTTLVAAKQAGIASLGIEAETRYCDLAASRLVATDAPEPEPDADADCEDEALSVVAPAEPESEPPASVQPENSYDAWLQAKRAATAVA